jgi:serine/threonine protein kinase
MWSCGIIMYILLTGKHPLWKEGENTKIFKGRLDKLDWKFPPPFNKSSTHLFLKLVDESPHERYTSEDVKNHPWITRNFTEDPPMTASERMKAFNDSQSVFRV